MKIFPSQQTRQEYLEIQIARSAAKFSYCKVSIHDCVKYKSILCQGVAGHEAIPGMGPIICLGTRNGREVDLFRSAFWGSSGLITAIKYLERETHSFVSIFRLLESLGRSNLDDIQPESAIGVEINPQAARSDIWIGSFDEMPDHWEGEFGLVYSNSFDQSHDPHKTAIEWKRILKPGGYLVFCYTRDAEPSSSDTVGGLQRDDVLEMFGGELVYFCEQGSRNGYSEIILRI